MRYYKCYYNGDTIFVKTSREINFKQYGMKLIEEMNLIGFLRNRKFYVVIEL